MKSKAEFIERWKNQLIGILFNGYTISERDAAVLFNMMKAHEQHLNNTLSDMYDDLSGVTPPPKQEKPAVNGSALPPRPLPTK